MIKYMFNLAISACAHRAWIREKRPLTKSQYPAQQALGSSERKRERARARDTREGCQFFLCPHYFQQAPATQAKKPADSGQGSMQGLFTEAVLAGAGEDGCGEALGFEKMNENHLI